MMSCPACGSLYATLLGILGKLAHLRCRDCGMDYNCDASEIEDDE